MNNRKRVIAFIMALAATTMNVPMVLSNSTATVAYATESSQSIRVSNQPEDYVGAKGSTAFFEIETEGDVASYQWQVSTNGGTSWSSTTRVTGYNTKRMTYTLTEARNGYMYRCMVTGTNGEAVYSDAASMTIGTVATLKINKQPEDYVGAKGSTAFFEIETEGDVASYQWLVSTNGGTSWSSTTRVTGYNTKRMTYTLTEARDGYMYRCMVTGTNGEVVYSDAASMTIGTVAALKINKQPEDYVGAKGSTAFFEIETEGDVASYQWQVSTNGGTSWSSTTRVTGYNTKRMTYTLTEARDGYMYRCMVTGTNGEVVYSDAASMTIGTVAALKINKQPEDYVGLRSSIATFEVEVEGSVASYQWQVSTDGGNSWTSTTRVTDYNTKKMSHALTESRNGYQYRCMITGVNGEIIYSDAASMTIAAKITLTDPTSTTITPDTDATFTIQATGTGDLTYSWESSTDGTTWSAISGANEATLTINGADAVDGTQYRCTVSDNYGQSKTSEPATLTIESASNQCGDELTYEYDEENRTLTIIGEGEMWSYTDAASSPFYDLDIDTLVIPDGVTVIGAHAFEGNSIQEVVLPESVFSIRYAAFWGNDDIDITVENIGCAIYDKSLPDNATVRGYSNSSAYHSSQGENQTFINLDDDSAFDASTNKIVLTVGDTYQINAAGSKLRYFSFNNDVVTVDNAGLVTAVGVAENDTDAKVVVYDKAGRSVVYYFAVVDENTAPDYSYRYKIVSPASQEQTIFVPFWGERISLNDDVAQIVDWDHAQPTGQFGTAPIISADDRGNAYLFYYTYDADIRPIKAEETYTEESFEITEDWQRAFCLPYYSFTADTDTRVYFKAYGSEDLDVAVYGELGADPITYDYNGGRAEVSFDVAAGQTVYIQPTAGQNQAFTYTMKLSTQAIESTEMADNAVYTVNPNTCGDLTTLAFTAPEDGVYLIEGKCSKAFHYDIANNDAFTSYEYDENGFELNESSRWADSAWSNGCTIIPYYVWLNADETLYLRGWFDEDTSSNDQISFRVHAVTPADTELALNTLTEPNVLSYHPDDFDRRTLTAAAGTQYRFVMDAADADSCFPLVWDKDWNVVSLDSENVSDTVIYSFNCNEDQTYHVIVLPQKADAYGSTSLTVSTEQEVDVNLWDEYTAFNTKKVPVTYHFTATTDGYYYFNTRYEQGYRDPMKEYGEIGDLRYNIYIHGENDANLYSFYLIEPDRGEWDTPFYLTEGQSVDFWFDQQELISTDSIRFDIEWVKPDHIELNAVRTNTISENSMVWAAFTAPADGTYLVSVSNDDPFSGDDENNPYICNFFTQNGWDGGDGFSSFVEHTFEMAEGETAWIRIESMEDTPLGNRFVVRNCDQPFETNLLEGTEWYVENSDCAAIAMTVDGFTLTVTDEGDNPWDTQVFASDFPIFEGNYYKLTFTKEAETESDKIPEALLQQNHSPWNVYGGYNTIDLNCDVSEVYFTAEGTSGLTKLLFDNFGVGTYTFSDISLVRITEEEYRAWEESVTYPYAHETYEGTVTENEPAWITLNITDADAMEVYEIVRIEGDVNVEMYEADETTAYELFFENGQNHWRAYADSDTTLKLKVTSNYGDQDYKIHFVKFERPETAVLEGETIGFIEPYSVDWYQFTAPEAGSYDFSFLGDSSVMNCEFYLDDMDGFIYNADAYWTDNFSTTLELEEGQTVWIKVTDNQYDYASGYSLFVNSESSNLNTNLINDASKWSSYCVDYASDDPTYTFDANQVNIELPIGFDGNFGAKYSGIDLTAGNVYTLSFDLATDGMASAEVFVRDSNGTVVQQFYGCDFGMEDEAQNNTFTFTATDDFSNCELIFYFYTSYVTEGSIPSSFVTISNISMTVTNDATGESGSED